MNTPIQPIPFGRKRHPHNTKLRLWWEAFWNGLLVQSSEQPLIDNYLETTRRVMDQSLHAHSRMLAVPLILHYPQAFPPYRLPFHNVAISRFLHFLNWEFELIKTTHAPDMRYIWCREQDTSDKPHYHVWLFFNGNAFRKFGTRETHVDNSDDAYDADCLFHRIVRAWAWAIEWPLEQMHGVVHLPKNNLNHRVCEYYVERDDHAAYRHVFHAASYLSKARSKPIGQGIHCFDASRR